MMGRVEKGMSSREKGNRRKRGGGGSAKGWGDEKSTKSSVL